MAGRFFPGSSVDSLYLALGGANRSQIIPYSVSGRGQRDPMGRFEYKIRRKVILVGSDAPQCKHLIEHTWLGCYGLEVLSVKQVSALINRVPECIDAVICCESTRNEAIQLSKRLTHTAQSAARTMIIMPSYYLLDSIGFKKDFKPRSTVRIGDMSFPAVTDSHGSDLYHQSGILDALLEVSSLRTKIWLSQSSLNDFMNWKSRVRSY